jgi:hypothetical protein
VTICMKLRHILCLQTSKMFFFSDYAGLPDVGGIAPLPSFVTSLSDSQPSRGASSGKIIFPDVRSEQFIHPTNNFYSWRTVFTVCV